MSLNPGHDFFVHEARHLTNIASHHLGVNGYLEVADVNNE